MIYVLLLSNPGFIYKWLIKICMGMIPRLFALNHKQYTFIHIKK